jgi:hypothetical protein
MTVRWFVGNAADVLRHLPTASVDCLITSPPYLGNRRYLPVGHPAAALEVGQEPTPGEALEALLAIMDEAHRILAPHGTWWVNLGDVHSGSGGAGGDYHTGGLRSGQFRYDGTASKARRTRNERYPKASAAETAGAEPRPQAGRWRGEREGWPMEQSVVWLAHLFGASLAYGRNLLTGVEHHAWVTRPPITWCKPNPAVGATGRKFRTATELIAYGGKHQDHYWDAWADTARAPTSGYHRDALTYNAKGAPPGSRERRTHHTSSATRPLYNWWEIPPARYKGTHFAVMPDQIVVPMLEAGCPRQVCTVCGTPSVRLVVPAERSEAGDDMATVGWSECGCGDGCAATTWRTERRDVEDADGTVRTRRVTVVDHIGECRDRSHLRRGIVLDPFAGTGTVPAVAIGHGRDAIGIDLNEHNVDLATERIGMWLHVEHLHAPGSRRVEVGA